MRFIDNGGVTDPRLNLALEEHLLLTLDVAESHLLFYVNEPAVIIGKHQNTVEEIDTAFVAERGIRVVRRISGGGAVYHDLGNLNFSVITAYSPERFNNYAEFTGPVVAALRSLGVPAEVTGRNDIAVEGRKVSGNAQVVRAGRMFSHGTLLLDTNLDDVTRALRVKPGKIESKGIQSIRSRVANIGEYLAPPIGIAEFRDRLLEHLFPGGPAVHALSDADRDAARALAARKYGTWEWNYGESPPFNLQRARRFPIGEIDLRVQVEDGYVRSIRFTGDFFSGREVSELERALAGVRYARAELAAVLDAADVPSYFAGLGAGDVLELLY